MYTIELLEKTIKLAEFKVHLKLNKPLEIKWEIINNKKFKVIINNNDPVFFINLFELINWITSTYNLIEIKEIISKIEPIFGTRELEFNEKMGDLDVRLILSKMVELGEYTTVNAKKLEEYVISLKGDKVCSISECNDFSLKLREAIHMKALREVNLKQHNSIERYGKYLKYRVKDMRN